MKTSHKAAGVATLAMLSAFVGSAPAHAGAYTPSGEDVLIYSTFAGDHCGRNGRSVFSLGDGNKQSLVMNYGWTAACDSTWWGGYGPGIQDLALCMRNNGGTQWYISTIVAQPGVNMTSHYDCANNGTYDRGLVGVGIHYYYY